MRLTKEEYTRILQFMKWGIEKKGLKDPDFNSAYQKLQKMQGSSFYNVYQGIESADEYSYLSELSEGTRKMVIEGVDSLGKNLYHSVMACLKSKVDKGFSKEACLTYYLDKYGEKYNLKDERAFYTEELVYYCYKELSRRYK